MRRIVLILALILFLAQSGFSQGAPLFKKGDMIAGAKVALGAVYGASFGLVADFEYGFQNDFLNVGDKPATLGFGGSFGYSSYTDDYSYGSWTYTNIILTVAAYYHVDVFKSDKLDTYLKAGLGFNFGGVSYSGPYGGLYSDPSVGFMTLESGLGARYYVSDKLSVAGEIGTGMGLLRIGVDYRL